mmetsp:Transcript_25387/g.58900  ORF Transcript_25387/g.58900 Transcript_25387/m.58900 type:complete len:246 (+) Transcript_25387:234-971(+)
MVSWPVVAKDAANIDVAGSDCHALFQAFKTFVDYWQVEHVDHILLCHLRRLHANGIPDLVNDGFSVWITTMSTLLIILVEALASLLAEALSLEHGIEHVLLRLCDTCLGSFAAEEVKAHKVVHPRGAHAHAISLRSLINFVRQQAFVEEVRKPRNAHDTVCDETAAVADKACDLLQLRPECHSSCDGGWTCARAPHILKQAHHIRRGEEMTANDILGPACGISDLVNVESAGVGSENATWFTHLV